MLNIKLETGLALAAIGLHAMFIAYITSFYVALSRPIDIGSVILIPWQLLIVGIFLFGLPGFGLAGISYIIARRDVPRIVSVILIAQGIMMPLGMLYSSMLANNIVEDYKSDRFLAVPQIFLIAGFAPIGLGVHLAKLKPMKRRMM
ncbi:MAG: hypothetical protein ACRD5H_02405 [Nitrososphaerales archaeon]